LYPEHCREKHRVVPADRETTEELVPERLALRDSRETTVLDLLGVELERVFRELEPLLDERGEFTDAAALFAENLLGVGCTDDNLTVLVSCWFPQVHNHNMHIPQCGRG
jgi:hypothetical protein